MVEYGDRWQGEFAGPRKSPNFRTTQNGQIQDHENGVFSGPPKNGRFSGPPKKRPIFRTRKKAVF